MQVAAGVIGAPPPLKIDVVLPCGGTAGGQNTDARAVCLMMARKGPSGAASIFARPPRRQKAEGLGAVSGPPCEHLPVPRHLSHDREDLPRPQVEPAITRLHRGQ